MNLERMLEKCRAGQWKPDDLDWSVAPRSMSREDEIAIVQYFTDMAGIERLAKALFEEQRRRTDDPVLQKIFSTFVVDEERHAVVAERLAQHYDVHHYRDYQMNEALVKFRPHFVHAIKYLPREIANVYVTAGELLLDVALLRSIDDYVDDGMSRQAMKLINRDESRHIAIDYHMVEYFASPAYLAELEEQGRPPLRDVARGLWTLGHVLYHARPFIQDVFVKPMAVVDPSGRRMREALKRMQLLNQRPDVAKRPFARFVAGVQALYNTWPGKLVFGRLLSFVAGVPEDMLRQQFTEAERAWAMQSSFDELAEDALAAKYAS
jgi:hypothetical protein